MLKISVKYNGFETHLLIYSTKFMFMDGKENLEYDFVEMKSLHVKNETDSYLLKIRLEYKEPIIFQFSNMHLRDISKAILFSKITVSETLKNAMIEKNVDACAIYNSVGKIIKTTDITNSKLWHTVSGPLKNSFYKQEGAADPFDSNFIDAITQPILDLFVSLNCTLNQFYNLFIQTYFYNIKNKKTFLDRMIVQKLRGFPTDLNYASRINSHSFLLTDKEIHFNLCSKSTKKKLPDFKPTFPLDKNEELQPQGRSCVISLRELKCDFSPTILGPKPSFSLDFMDLKPLKEMCRIVYLNDTNFISEALKFGDELERLIIKERGKDEFKYFERLFPKFYKKL